MVFASIREHAEHCDFFASTSRNKKFALRAAISLESTTREQRALLRFLYFPLAAIHMEILFFKIKQKIFENGVLIFNLEPTKFFEASLSDT